MRLHALPVLWTPVASLAFAEVSVEGAIFHVSALQPLVEGYVNNNL